MNKSGSSHSVSSSKLERDTTKNIENLTVEIKNNNVIDIFERNNYELD